MAVSVRAFSLSARCVLSLTRCRVWGQVGLERAAAAEYGIWVEGRGTFAAVDSTIAAYSLEPGVRVQPSSTD